MHNNKLPDWMHEETQRASKQAETGQTTNAHAPTLVRSDREPKRKQKAFYIQPAYAEAFEQLAFQQKQIGGQKATELAEEMIFDLLSKYGEDVTKLQR